jgi:hypothetical protein
LFQPPLLINNPYGTNKLGVGADQAQGPFNRRQGPGLQCDRQELAQPNNQRRSRASSWASHAEQCHGDGRGRFGSLVKEPGFTKPSQKEGTEFYLLPGPLLRAPGTSVLTAGPGGVIPRAAGAAPSRPSP